MASSEADPGPGSGRVLSCMQHALHMQAGRRMSLWGGLPRSPRDEGCGHEGETTILDGRLRQSLRMHVTAPGVLCFAGTYLQRTVESGLHRSAQGCKTGRARQRLGLREQRRQHVSHDTTYVMATLVNLEGSYCGSHGSWMALNAVRSTALR